MGNLEDASLDCDNTLAQPQRIKLIVKDDEATQHMLVASDAYLGLYDIVAKRWLWQMKP